MKNHSIENTAEINTIQKKLLGKELSYKEIYNLMDKISKDKLGDILTTYFIAASFKEGFSSEELYYFTKAMVETGTKIHFDGIVADKHSTGGLAGTRTTLIVVPIIAAAGFKIPKTSSRAITSPAGTADVMETFSKVSFYPDEIKTIVKNVGGCIVWGGHLGIAPADDNIIEIEEQLSFESFDKVIVSIMSKHVAVSTNHLILDIPIGPTMKIKHQKEAEKISDKFKILAKKFDIKLEIDINKSLEPAGNGIGPLLEAKDALKVLEQVRDRPIALENRALTLAGKLLNLCFETVKIKKNGEDEAKSILQKGLALAKFKEIIKAQKGNPNIESRKIKIKSKRKDIKSNKYGKIEKINNYYLNMAAKILGAPEDKNAGIYLFKKIGDKIENNESLMSFYANNSYRLDEAANHIVNFPIYEITK